MKSVLIFFCLIFAIASSAIGQADTMFRHVKTLRGDVVSFTVDNLDNIYILTATNQIRKLGPNGDSIATFNDVKNYGQATLIDVSNPLKVLLYYRDFATIVVLDRFLNVRNTIDLRKHNILQVQAIGQSYDNKIWLYDEVENKLKKIDDDGTLMLETPDFRLLFDEAPTPQKVFDQDLHVYLYDSAKAVFVFDYYGTLQNKILITGWKNFRVGGKYIYGSRNLSLFRYDITTFRYDEWNMPKEIVGSTSYNFTTSRLYALKEGALSIFQFR